MREAIIFNIQKFSLHDGDGIRTTIFFLTTRVTKSKINTKE